MRTGWAVAAGSEVSDFDLKSRTGRGKSEHYRAASPLTAGRLTVTLVIVGRRQVQQRTDQPRIFEVMGETVRPDCRLNVRAHRHVW